MADFNSKYTGQEVENLLDQMANGNTGGGGVTSETDPIFSASPAFNITDEDIDNWNSKQDTISDLDEIRSGASKGATAVQPEDIPNSAEPMVCAYRISSATANHIDLENYTYNGQTMDYREGAIILITNPLGEDVVFEGGTLTLDGNEYEADAFTIEVGATALFTLGVDSGILFPVSSVVESNSGGSSEGEGSTAKEVVMVGSDTIDLLEPNKVYILSVPQTTLQISEIAYPDDNYAEYCIMGMKGESFSSEPFEPQPMSLLLPTDYQFYWAGESQDSLTTGDTWELSIVYTASGLTEGFKCVLTKFT